MNCTCALCSKGKCCCDAYSNFFSVLGNANRLHILNALRIKPMSVNEISQATSLEQSCVSHCLKLLTQNHFVTYEQEGKYRIYSLESQIIDKLLSIIDSFIAQNKQQRKEMALTVREKDHTDK